MSSDTVKRIYVKLESRIDLLPFKVEHTEVLGPWWGWDYKWLFIKICWRKKLKYRL